MLMRSPLRAGESKDQDVVISINDVWVKFRIYHDRKNTLKERIVKLKGSIYEDFWALKGVTLDIKRGNTVGIIGHNGSGKSTLLKCIAGLLQVNKGGITVNGRVSPLLELGAGFHPDLTGRENIYLNGAILGLTRRQIKDRYNDIVKFAELENFIDTPVRNYSSGMYVRLGFAIAVHSDPDILLVDEVLAVGDEAFQKKCFDKINEFKGAGVSIILVTHDVNKVYQLCDSAILLNQGEVVCNGSPNEVVATYRSYIEEKEQAESETVEDKQTAKRFGTREAEIVSVDLLDQTGKSTLHVKSGEDCTFKLKVVFHANVTDPIAGYVIRNSKGEYLYDTNTLWRGKKTGLFKKGDEIEVLFSQKMNLLAGTYTFTTAIAYADGVQYCDWQDDALSFEVADDSKSAGLVNCSANIKFLDAQGKVILVC